MTLTYTTLVRQESDLLAIATLLRKGWIENPPPAYNATTQNEPVWNGTQWLVTNKEPEAIAAAKRKTWTGAQFRSLFTDAELAAFSTAAKSNTTIDVIRFKYTTADKLVSDDPQLLAALDALVTAGVLTASRKAQIIA